MSFSNKILLLFVILGLINIIILSIIKVKSKYKEDKQKENYNMSRISVLNYNNEDLICMVDSDLELKYGYECSDLETFENMKINHRNVYTLLWFDREMKNGGLGEYLFSTSNITMNYLRKSLENVGALKLLKNYTSFIKENHIEDEINNIEKRNVEEYTKFMNKFDFSKFNDSYEKVNLRSLIADYIRANIIDFYDLSEEELTILKEMNKQEKLISNN